MLALEKASNYTAMSKYQNSPTLSHIFHKKVAQSLDSIFLFFLFCYRETESETSTAKPCSCQKASSDTQTKSFLLKKEYVFKTTWSFSSDFRFSPLFCLYISIHFFLIKYNFSWPKYTLLFIILYTENCHVKTCLFGISITPLLPLKNISHIVQYNSLSTTNIIILS
jgi:hypothetical protein